MHSLRCYFYRTILHSYRHYAKKNQAANKAARIVRGVRKLLILSKGENMRIILVSYMHFSYRTF